MAPQRQPIANRFWPKVDQRGPDECWGWLAAVDGFGYGVMSGPIRNRIVRAHRLSYELTMGPIPKGLFVMHSCDNPPCVNPRHLSVGTHFDNMRDAGRKKRNFSPGRGATHCTQGHEFTPENTGYRKGRLHRYCRVCSRANSARQQRARRLTGVPRATPRPRIRPPTPSGTRP